VESGDTLYVCGTHVYSYGTGGRLINSVTVVSGSPGNPITIRGDCAGDPGIVWSSCYLHHQPWVDEGENTYSITLPGDQHPRANYFEDISGGSATLLYRVETLEECKNTPGSFYSPDYQGGSKFYVHCTDGGDPTDRVVVNRWGYEFGVDGDSYVTFRNLTFRAPYQNFHLSNKEHHIRWEDCDFKYNEGPAIEFRANSDIHDMTVTGCTASYGREGIFAVGGPGGTGLYNFEFSDNTIHHMGYPTEWYTSGDRHCMGTQDARNGVISGNELYACEHGLVLYANNADQIITNITVKNNYVHDMNPGTHGISFRGDGVNAGENKDNKIYHNIIAGCEFGFYLKYGYNIDVFNNVIYDCNWALSCAGGSGQPGSPKVTFKNNILLNSGTYHVRFITAYPEGEYMINSDYNLYYPFSGNLFYFGDNWGTANQSITETDFEGWQALSRSGSTFDPNSLALDPLFLNAKGNYSEDTDFRISSFSPAIDSGTDVGLTIDFDGNPIPVGIAPDIGAFEYADCGPVEGDLNGDCSVTILDLAIIALDFGKRSGFDPRSDTIASGEIDVYDLVFVASRFS